jgi:hypothetical protein
LALGLGSFAYVDFLLLGYVVCCGLVFCLVFLWGTLRGKDMRKIIFILICILGLMVSCDKNNVPAEKENIEKPSKYEKKVDKVISEIKNIKEPWAYSCKIKCGIQNFSRNDILISIYEDGWLFLDTSQIPLTNKQRKEIKDFYNKVVFSSEKEDYVDKAINNFLKK